MRARGFDGRRRHRDRLAADPRLGARRLSGGQRLAKKLVQRATERLRVRRGDVRIFDLSEDLGFADQHRIETRADAEEMFDRSTPEMRVKIRFQIVTRGAVTEIREERFDLCDAALVIVERRVNLEPSARLQHRSFANGFVVAQRDERLQPCARPGTHGVRALRPVRCDAKARCK